VRLLLEPHASFVATTLITDIDLSLLKVDFDRLQTLADDSEEKRLLIVQTDNKLHRTIWLSCNNREIADILDRYLDRVRRIQLATMEMANRLTPSEHEMRQIFEALTVRDAKRARKAMYAHISNIKQAIDEVMKNRYQVACNPSREF
jgi:DNA-binding GntR family transcriptional regulator